MRITRWFLDIFLDGETLRWWSGNGAVSLAGNTYTGLGSRWVPPERLKRSASMKSEKVEIEFDSSRQSDNSDPIGALLDARWRRRQVRLRRLAWAPGDGPDEGTVLEDERGRIRNLSDKIQQDEPARISMEIESGALAYLERRMETRTPASQKAVFPDDQGFDLIAQLEGVTLPWRTKHKKVGTVQIEMMREYEPVPRRMAVGRFVTDGSFVAAFTNQAQRKNFVRIYAIADHRIRMLDRVWVNGELVRSSALTHGTRTLIRLEGDRGEDRCWMTYYDGRTDQVADSFLQSVESTWTSEHRLRGVSYVIVDHLWDSDLPENFDYRFGGEGGFFYDRRADSTAGGSGSQRWGEPDTWAYTTNAMVIADHYRSGIRIMSGSAAMWFGLGEDRDAVPYGEFAGLANHCAESVPLKNGGSQARYEVNGIITADQSHDEVLQKIADQMAARAVDQGGRISIRPPVVRETVITLTDGDLKRGTESIIDTGGRIDDMVNTIEGRFISPENDYKRDSFPKVRRSDYIDEDAGEIADTLNLDLEISGERAQRIAHLVIEDSRRILEIEETYMSMARVIAPGEWFIRESVIRGFPDGKMFVAEEVERFDDGSICVRSVEIDPDQLVWDEETAVDISVPPGLPPIAIDPLAAPVITVAPVAIVAGDATLPAVRLTHEAYADFIGDEIIVELGFSNGLEDEDLAIAGQSQFAKIPGNQETVDAFVGLPPSTAFAIRFRSRFGERHSAWSSFQEFYSTSIYRVGDITTIGGRTAEEVLADLDTNAESIAREILMRATWQAANESLMWIGGETVGAVAVDARELNEDSALSLSLLGVRNEADTAFILAADTLTIPSDGSPGSSAISLLTLRTQHDQNRADIVFLLESFDGEAASARLTLDVNGYITGFSIINDGTPETSGFYVIADNFAILSPGNGVTAPFFPFAVAAGVVYMSNVVVDTLAAASITTNNLIDNSVSNSEVVTQSGPWTLSNAATGSATNPPHGTGFSTIFDDDYVMHGGNLMLHVSFVNQLSGGSYCAVFCQVLIDDVVADSRTHILPAQFGDTKEWTFGFVGVASGTRNIKVRVRANRASSGEGGTGGDSVTVSSCRVIIQEMKK